MNPTAQKPSSSLLVQMFEPIRTDLEKVEREFVRHLESQVALIPTIGHYVQQGGGWKSAAVLLRVYSRWIEQALPAPPEPPVGTPITSFGVEMAS